MWYANHLQVSGKAPTIVIISETPEVSIHHSDTNATQVCESVYQFHYTMYVHVHVLSHTLLLKKATFSNFSHICISGSVFACILLLGLQSDRSWRHSRGLASDVNGGLFGLFLAFSP